MIKKKINSGNKGYELYEYIFNTENEQLSYLYSEEEEPIKFATGIDKKYYTIVKKWDNFISKALALTKEYEHLPFSQKYPELAQTIREAAQRGESNCSYVLSFNEIDALRAEGFTVQQAIYYNKPSTISW